MILRIVTVRVYLLLLRSDAIENFIGIFATIQNVDELQAQGYASPWLDAAKTFCSLLPHRFE